MCVSACVCNDSGVCVCVCVPWPPPRSPPLTTTASAGAPMPEETVTKSVPCSSRARRSFKKRIVSFIFGIGGPSGPLTRLKPRSGSFRTTTRSGGGGDGRPGHKSSRRPSNARKVVCWEDCSPNFAASCICLDYTSWCERLKWHGKGNSAGAPSNSNPEGVTECGVKLVALQG